MRTLDRYVLREVLPPFALALLIFTFLLVLPPVMDYLENLLAKGITWGTAAWILWTLVPQALGLTIPMALLVGILIGLGRMSADRESVALLACGVSPYRLLRPLVVFAVLAALATGYVMIVAIPQSNQAFRQITFTLVSQRVETEIQPRVFYQDFPGWVLYAREEPDPGDPGWKKLMVANTTQSGETTIFFANRGHLAVDKERRTVDLILISGTSYKMGESAVTARFNEQILKLDAESVFPKINIQPGLNEKTISVLREDAARKVKDGLSPHPEVIAIQQKFSIPAACFVFAIVGLALGLTVAREGKLAGFVVGIVVIFAYYIVMFFCESLTKGHHLNMYMSRWIPDIVLGIFGVVALIWRARNIEGRFPFRLEEAASKISAQVRARIEKRQAAAGVAGGDTSPRPSRSGVRTSGPAPVLVVRFPRVRLPVPGLLDRYISRTYLKIVGLSFLALLGLFYISTFIDRSDKIFKGQATIADVVTLLVYLTPRFVYFVIPIAALLSVLVTFGLLSRNSELTVMKACGVSLYRASLSVVLLSLVFSTVIFSLEQRVLARANRQAEIIDSKIKGRTPRVFDSLNRQWLIGRDGGIYHYIYYDPDRKELAQLTIYQPATDGWRLATTTATATVRYASGAWTGQKVRIGNYARTDVKWANFDQRPIVLESPDYFETEQPVAEMMTVTQLRRYVNELSSSGLNVVHLAVELQHKMAFPFVTLVMTLLAIPFGVSTGRRGALYAVGLGIILALSYWIVTSLFVALGKSGILGPMLAAWSPNIIVLGSAAYLFLTVRT
jgi:LPS export ABC transporter permease LptG/LPS export ABC transporter permease LptF